jgi:hypothetical protein
MYYLGGTYCTAILKEFLLDVKFFFILIHCLLCIYCLLEHNSICKFEKDVTYRHLRIRFMDVHTFVDLMSIEVLDTITSDT